MIRVRNIRLPLDHSEDDLRAAAASAVGLTQDALVECRIFRRSIDARKRSNILLMYSVDIVVESEVAILAAIESTDVGRTPDATYKHVGQFQSYEATRPVVIGSGPCGLFAGLILAEMGLRPIVLERGKRAKERAGDVASFWQEGTLNTRSNVAFGEGGAGTFSDGKLTTQIKDRDNRCRKVLEELVRAGAPEEILYLSKPHIGTDILIRVVGELSTAIESHGGEIRFETCVTGFMKNGDAVTGVALEDGSEIPSPAVVLAIGHSARDTFEMLLNSEVTMEPKAFSVGVRIEHPQELIDRAQFGAAAGHPRLGRADYKLVHHCANGRSAYTFCMCPGGQVIAAATEEGGIVTNGMSASTRSGSNANSGLLVGVTPEDFGDTGPLAGVAFQRRWEQLAYALGGANYQAPAQLVADFLASRASEALGTVPASYRPGVTLCDLAACLPPYAIDAMREAIPVFDRKLRGFAMDDAVMTGVETRSSSPVRILRGPTQESVSTPGLYPAGEGAGYAGGIVSAAVDGIRVAEAVARNWNSTKAS
jgi:uncharacterized FAD-dependent dehydrogenase